MLFFSLLQCLCVNVYIPYGGLLRNESWLLAGRQLCMCDMLPETRESHHQAAGAMRSDGVRGCSRTYARLLLFHYMGICTLIRAAKRPNDQFCLWRVIASAIRGGGLAYFRCKETKTRSLRTFRFGYAVHGVYMFANVWYTCAYFKRCCLFEVVWVGEYVCCLLGKRLLLVVQMG